MRYHLFQKLFGKMVKIKEMSFFSTRGMGLMFGNCIYFEICHFKADFATIQKESWMSEANVNPNCKPTLDVIQIPLKWGTYLLPLEGI